MILVIHKRNPDLTMTS